MRIFLLAFFCLSQCIWPQSKAEPSSQTVVFTNVNIVDTRDGRILPDVTVVVRGGRIQGVARVGLIPNDHSAWALLPRQPHRLTKSIRHVTRGSDRVIPSDLPKDDSKSRLGDCVQHCCHPRRCKTVDLLGSGSAHECGSSGHELVHHYYGRECAIAPPIEIAACGNLARTVPAPADATYWAFSPAAGATKADVLARRDKLSVR
jgi:hypothetical protein